MLLFKGSNIQNVDLNIIMQHFLILSHFKPRVTKNENTVESCKSVKLCTVFCCNFTETVSSGHVIVFFTVWFCTLSFTTDIHININGVLLRYGEPACPMLA